MRSSSTATASCKKPLDCITEEQWKQFCTECELTQHESLISECSDAVTLLLTLIEKQHGELDTQTELVKELSKVQSACGQPCKSIVRPPRVHIARAEVEDDSVVVVWKGELQADNKYHIKFDSIGESRQVEVKPSDIRCIDNFCSTRITRLKPWEEYQLWVCSENSAGMGEWSEPIKVVMNKSPPPKPTEMSVNLTEPPDTKSDELQFEIDQPVHCELVEEYRLVYQDEKGEPVTLTGKVDQTYNTAFTIPFAKFRNLRFSVKNKYGWSLPSDIIRASDLRPSKVPTFTYVIDSVTEDSVELVWEVPSTNSALVEHYKLEWCASKKMESTKEIFHTVCNLLPNTEYCFRVYPITKAGKRGESSEELVVKTKPTSAYIL